jgi:Putative Ig domain
MVTGVDCLGVFLLTQVTCPGANGCPSFTYPQNITLELGVAMTPVAPSSVQFASQFTVLNPLPSGLVINASTGVISGTPNATGILTAAIQGTTQYFPSYPFVHGGTFSAVVGFSIGPANNPVSVSFSDSDNRANRLSGSITVAVPATETDISSYELHWGSSPSVRLTSASSIATGLMPTGSNIVFSLPVGTTRPVGATHIIAYSRNGGFGLRPAAVAISDFGA